ncbi:3-phenylpropionate/cinnamic acid dioxygenase ferredoxin--NAD(+) reductase subunit [Diaphorobacter caeni]|uniref:3-phenylpropionate/cinnamic acid dioxygenase ferredoxin--NAD(+) reductase subunit n=1 Tax=Diaphorobacter caeni TaxID=2784387 RepID=UPI00188E4751|nr:3-phenylpropionate/cinnamic acid dioxygenase ferredoxin--NAD(+) reductase subunit [Diaphorobacter caeni]MBF5007163.1 FAD-dependent oxidoreductase [Diaphorobacter caeni]
MKDPFNAPVVILGAGQAGAAAAMELRKLGHVGAITLVGEERQLPYERPPLSKEALLRPDETRVLIREARHYSDIRVDLRLGVRAVEIAAVSRRVWLSDDTWLEYDFLILATGARARRLPMLDALGDRVHRLRTMEDATRLRSQLERGARAVVVGAGVIGLELASSLVELGLTVEVVDPASRVMSRNAPEVVSRLLHDAHVRRGVRFHLGTSVESACRLASGIRLVMSDGVALEGDLVIYGVGAVVDDGLLRTAGVDLLNGALMVDEHCQTSVPGILAAGDVTVCVDGRGVPRRMETWENANTQAIIAARTLLGLDSDPPQPPWFWTDQCGMNIQFAGDMAASDWIRRGDPLASNFMFWGLREGLVTAAVTVNWGREMRSAKLLIAKGISVPSHVLADPLLNLRQLAKSGAFDARADVQPVPSAPI